MIKSLQKNLLSYSCATGFALVGIMFLFQPSAYAVDNIKASSCLEAELAYKKCKSGKSGCDTNASKTIGDGKATTQSSASSGSIRTSVNSLKDQDKVRMNAARSGNYKTCIQKCLVTYTAACKAEAKEKNN